MRDHNKIGVLCRMFPELDRIASADRIKLLKSATRRWRRVLHSATVLLFGSYVLYFGRVAMGIGTSPVSSYFPAGGNAILWALCYVTGFLALWMGLSIIIIAAARNSVRRTLRGTIAVRDRALCETCGYDLRGLTGRVCPECGTDRSGISGATEIDGRRRRWIEWLFFKEPANLRRNLTISVVACSGASIYFLVHVLRNPASAFGALVLGACVSFVFVALVGLLLRG